MASTRLSCLLLLVVASIQDLRIPGVLAAPMRRRHAPDGCPQDGPDVGQCVESYLQYFFNVMSSGQMSPNFDITPFDPLLLSNLTIIQDNETKAVYVHRYLVGLKNTFFHSTRLQFNTTVLMPAMEMLGMFSSKRLEDHQITENSILTVSIRSSVANFRADGELYKQPNGARYLRLRLAASDLSIGHYMLSDRDAAGYLPPTNRQLHGLPVDHFMKLIEKDLRVQLTERLQHFANEALALAPFDKFFPV